MWNILEDKQWRSVLSDLFVELGGAWLVLVIVAPAITEADNLVRELIARLFLGILSLVIAKMLKSKYDLARI